MAASLAWLRCFVHLIPRRTGGRHRGRSSITGANRNREMSELVLTAVSKFRVSFGEVVDRERIWRPSPSPAPCSLGWFGAGSDTRKGMSADCRGSGAAQEPSGGGCFDNLPGSPLLEPSTRRGGATRSGH